MMLSITLQVLIGLGVFLYGMSQLEKGIQALSDVQLKLWLSRSTGSPVSSAFAGALFTAILQSSSMVSLLILAFASAGIIPLYNAVGVLLGANLGTTFTGWIVATLGFKLSLTSLALPLVGAGAFSQVLLRARSRLSQWGQVLLGLGLLLFGLSIMKDSVGAVSESWDIAVLQGFHPVVYLLAGVIAAALIQSSSAVVMMTLAALHSGLVSLPEAGALVIGADLGTTSTVLLGSITGATIKRQLALAHLVFNVVVDLIAFVVFLPFMAQLIALLNLNDPLYSLVAFHSFINLVGVLAFLPFLKHYSQWISRRFKDTEAPVSVLSEIPVEVPEAALPALRHHVQMLWLNAAVNNLRYFALLPDKLNIPQETRVLLEPLVVAQRDQEPVHVYESLKQSEVEILQFSFRLQQQPLNADDARYLSCMIEMARATVYASKTLRDISHDLQQIADALRHSTTGSIGWIYTEQRQYHQQLYQQLIPLLVGSHNEAFIAEQLSALEVSNNAHQEKMNRSVYGQGQLHDNGLPSLSTLLNLNREIHHATSSLLKSVALWREAMLLPQSALQTAEKPALSIR
jgi:phosphate:Na+ symporter